MVNVPVDQLRQNRGLVTQVDDPGTGRNRHTIGRTYFRNLVTLTSTTWFANNRPDFGSNMRPARIAIVSGLR